MPSLVDPFLSQDAFVWVVYLVGEKDERGNALFANVERGVGIFLQYRPSDLYPTDRKETVAILQKDTHTPLRICK